METIVCKCRVITPMFSSGADQTGCEIRVPEIKAAMRFWWRAAHSNLSLDELRKRETLIFGGSGDEEARKSSFTMRVENQSIREYTQNDWNTDLSKYTVTGTRQGNPQSVKLFDWLGFGVVQMVDTGRINPKTNKSIKENRIQRSGLKQGTTFDLIIHVDEKYTEDVKEALNLFSCFGSLGAKSRNGFGRVVIDGYKTDAADLCITYSKIKNILPEYTGFSENISLFKTNSTYKTWHEALFQIGKAYREARVGKHATEGLLGDHHSGKNRQYIALPLIVDKHDVNEIKTIDRMAKQFFMIVEPEYKNGKEEYRGYILHMPFNFKKFGDFSKYKKAFSEMNDIFFNNDCLEEVEI